MSYVICNYLYIFFFKDPATTKIYTSDTLFPDTTLVRSQGAHRRDRRGARGRLSSAGQRGTHVAIDDRPQRVELAVARQHVVEIAEEARGVGEVAQLAVAMAQPREDAQHLEVALHANQVEVRSEEHKSELQSIMCNP